MKEIIVKISVKSLIDSFKGQKDIALAFQAFKVSLELYQMK